MTKSISLSLILGLVLVAVAYLYSPVLHTSAAGWLPAHIQTATTTTVGPDIIVTVFADQTQPTCKSRVISTTDSAIMVSFDDVTGFGSTTISGTAGHWQAGSTTVAYDSALYGCGLVSAFGYSSTTITVSSF